MHDLWDEGTEGSWEALFILSLELTKLQKLRKACTHLAILVMSVDSHLGFLFISLAFLS